MSGQTAPAPGGQPGAQPQPGAQAVTRRDLEARIVAKAWRDPAFKALLTTDPKAAVQAELRAIDPSVTLPPALRVAVHEETPNHFHLVLPRNPRDIHLGEVLGGDLEVVAPQTVAVVVNVMSGPVAANVILTSCATMNTGPAAANVLVASAVIGTTATVA